MCSMTAFYALDQPSSWEAAPDDVTACEIGGHRFEDGRCVDCGELTPPEPPDDEPEPTACVYCARPDCAGDCHQRYEAMEDEIFDEEVL